MSLYKTIPVPDGLLAVWKLDESLSDLLSVYVPEMEEKSLYQSIGNEKRQKEFLATRVLLKVLLGSDFGLSYTNEGIPILRHQDFHHLSISHSQHFLAVYCHKFQSVGIDVESVNRNFSAIKNRFLSLQELHETNNNATRLCLCWCAKEAIFKLVDDTGIDFKRQIEVLPFKPGSGQFYARFTSDTGVSTYRLNYLVFEQHAMVWVNDKSVPK